MMMMMIVICSLTVYILYSITEVEESLAETSA